MSEGDMATFKVGQRVRVLPNVENPWADEGTVTGFWPDSRNSPDRRGYTVFVVCDNHPGDPNYGNAWLCHPRDLRPLTPPGFSEFMERVLRDTGEPITLDDEILEKVRV
jgi:hypothetical protein